MKLRLLLFERCNRNCDGCCNKDWDLKSLPIENDFSQYDEIILTGGEPMLDPLLIIKTSKCISKQSPFIDIFLYTAKTDNWQAILSVLHYVDGLTVTLHEQKDIKPFLFLNNILLASNEMSVTTIWEKSFRVNIFKNIVLDTNLRLWEVKDNIEWIKNCPLPTGEVFKRLY